MADHLLNGGDDDDDDIFVYVGGEQRVPRDVKRVRIAKNIDTIPRLAFAGCEQLIEVEGHNKLKKIEQYAFCNCPSLRRLMKMNGVIEIEDHAFKSCRALSELDFDNLQIIGFHAFAFCESLRSINLPSIKRIGHFAFAGCTQLTDVAFGEDLGRIERNAFTNCPSLRRIAIPLKRGLINEGDNRCLLQFPNPLPTGAFSYCKNLSRVDIVGGIHKTISSLHMESWKDTMKEEIDRINQILPDASPSGREKTDAIREWIDSVIDRIEHYKSEHFTLVMEAMALLELALWKAKLIDEYDGNESELTMVQRKRVRQECRITSGASIVIKNVLPFLQLDIPT